MKRMLSLCMGAALLLTGGLSHADGMDGISAASPLAHGESVSTAAAGDFWEMEIFPKG